MTALSPEFIQYANKLVNDHPDDIVAVYNLDSTCAWASPTHETILGYSQTEMIGLPWTRFVAPRDRAHASLAGADAMLTGRSVEFGFSAVTKSGDHIPVRGHAWIRTDEPTHKRYLIFQASPRP